MTPNAMMARYLIEASDSPQSPSSCSGYPAIQDVPCSDPDWGYVEQALLDGITSGCQTNPLRYCPSDPIVRSSMAVMLVVAKYTSSYAPPACQSTNRNLPGYNPFTDVSNTSGFCPFIAQIYHDGVTAGCNQNPPQYCPGNPVTEQQMTIFMSVYWPSYHPITTGATYTLRDDENRVVTQLTDSIPGRDNVYLGPLLVGSYVSDATVDSLGWQFHSSDHLGTVRETWRVTPNTFEYHKYWPYGDEVGTNAAPAQKISFAAMERDVEATHYYDHARSHDFNLGRFINADQLNGGQRDPQTWTRYSYGRGNPLRIIDPTGLYDCAASAEECERFEAARQADLDDKKNSAAVVAAAKAYGGPHDKNGIVVTFGSGGSDEAGSVKVTGWNWNSEKGREDFSATVTIDPNKSGTELEALVGHEGSHLLDNATFFASAKFTGQAFGWLLSKNITHRLSEGLAYHITHEIFKARGETANILGVGKLGAGVPDSAVDQAIGKILATPQYMKGGDLDKPILGDPWDKEPK